MDPEFFRSDCLEADDPPVPDRDTRRDLIE